MVCCHPSRPLPKSRSVLWRWRSSVRNEGRFRHASRCAAIVWNHCAEHAVLVHEASGVTMRKGLFGLAVVGLMGCASGGYPVVIGDPRPDVVVVGDDDRDYPDRRGRGRGGRGDDGYRGYRSLRVPPGHYPPRGACRVWYEGRPPGRQPRATSCDRLYGRVPYGAFILYNGNAWDADYDWYRHERRYRGTVPRVIVQIVQSRDRRR
jgi:hypothetical protein